MGKKGRKEIGGHGRWVGALALCLLVFFVRDEAVARIVPLDQRTVFCLYYWLSGEPIDDKDLEAMSRGLGRPTYTDYKPSEMFTRHTLRRLRAELRETLDGFDHDTVFVSTATLSSLERKQVDVEHLLPSPTPYIQAELTNGGRRAMSRMLGKALKGKSGRGPDFRVAVSFRPVRIRHVHQQRNIALETVSLPIRLVVMEPVGVDLLDSGKDATASALSP